MKMFKHKKQILFTLKIIVAIVLYASILKNVDWSSIPGAIEQTNLQLICSVILLMALNTLMCAYKWKLLLMAQGIHFRFSELSKWYFSTFFFNNFFPSTLGGDGYRLIKTMNNPHSKTGAAMAIVMERAMGAFALLFLGFTGGIFSYIQFHDDVSLASIIIGFSGMCIILGCYALLNVKDWVPEKVKQLLSQKIYTNQTLPVLLLSILYQLLIVVSRLLLVYSIGQSLSFSAITVTTVISSIVALIPITLNGLGLMDGSFIFLLTYYGINYEHAVIVMLLIRLIQIPFSLLGGILHLFEKKNWRKPIMYALMKGAGSPIPKELQLLRSIEYKTPEEIREIQQQRLVKLLLHAWKNTDYYKEVLSECNVVKDGKVNLDNFENIPFLTKEIIRSEFHRLKAKDHPSYSNRTGSSTGEPVEYLQDNTYWDINVATKLYHFAMHGKEIGALEMKIWGSDRDIVNDTTGMITKLKTFFYNREIRTCESLSENGIRSIVDDINQLKPKTIWGYTDGIYTIASYIQKHNLNVYPPVALFGGGGTLFPHMVQTIEDAFHAPMINMYGSREMGDIACQCLEKTGLHISSHSHYLEIVNKGGIPVLDEDGDIIVTSLHNYAMPFLRYRIGDRGRLTAKKCPCGRGFPLLETVLGRGMESLITKDGRIISPIFLITKLGAVLNIDQIKKYQLIQNDYSKITLKIIPRSEVTPGHQQEITTHLKSIMGHDCEVKFNLVEDIPTTKSGKYLYIASEVEKK